MKKPTKRVLIGSVLLVGVIIPLFTFYLIRFLAETAKMAALDTGEVLKGIYSIDNGFVNLFLIKSPNGYIAIDAGNSAGKIEKEMKKLNIDQDEVLAVLLTHTDSDHVAGINLFVKAKVYLSKAEEQMINGKTSRALIFKNKLEREYELLDDNQELVLDGIHIECILTPGHTPGSMCYLVNDNHLFTGDTISLKNGKAGLFNEFFNMDSEKQKESIKKLSKLTRVQNVITAHYGFSNNYQEVFSDYK